MKLNLNSIDAAFNVDIENALNSCQSMSGSRDIQKICVAWFICQQIDDDRANGRISLPFVTFLIKQEHDMKI